MRLQILLIIYLVSLGFLIPLLTQMTFASLLSNFTIGTETDNITRTETDNITRTETDSITGTEQMTLKAEMEPHESQGLADSGWYQIKKFGFVASNGSEICPQNNCKYTVENGQFTPNTFTGGYVFEGKLKVTTQEGDIKKSKFYDFRIYLEKTSEEERNGETVQSLEGSFAFALGQDISFDITNATLKVDDKNPVLTIQGEMN